MSITKSNKYLFPTEEDVFIKNLPQDEEVKEEEEVIEDKISSQTRIFKPKKFEDAKEIANAMMADCQTVIVNLANIIKDPSLIKCAERIIDFLFGVSYPLKMFVSRVDESTFIFSKEELD